MDIGLLFSEGEVLAMDKPAGMISQGPGTGPIPELWQVLRARWPEGNIVHRIDRFTSGMILGATSRRAAAYFQRNWHEITKKVYLAVIANPSWDEQLVSMPLDGKTAETSFMVLERGRKLSLVRCELVRNGRTHQIRRHLRMLGRPIVDDRKYKGPLRGVRPGQLLHAWRVSVRLPDADYEPTEWTTFQAPIPRDLRSLPFDWGRWNGGATMPLQQIPAVA